jgi:predicted DNA-binding transcriptional regulator AlpA
VSYRTTHDQEPQIVKKIDRSNLPNPVNDSDRFLDDHEAAEFVGLKKQTLQVWRINGQGPAFYKIGRSVKYRLSDLIAYIESRRCRNTAEADALA